MMCDNCYKHKAVVVRVVVDGSNKVWCMACLDK
jgi:hypothetical protein